MFIGHVCWTVEMADDVEGKSRNLSLHTMWDSESKHPIGLLRPRVKNIFWLNGIGRGVWEK